MRQDNDIRFLFIQVFQFNSFEFHYYYYLFFNFQFLFVFSKVSFSAQFMLCNHAVLFDSPSRVIPSH